MPFILKLSRKNFLNLFLLYCIVLFYIVFLTPNRYDGREFNMNLYPVIKTLSRIRKPTGEPFWRYYLEYWGNIFGNVILFIPLGYSLKYIFKMRSRKVFMLGLLISISIEIIQLFLKIGVCDIDDVLLNVSGIFIGVMIFNKYNTAPDK